MACVFFRFAEREANRDAVAVGGVVGVEHGAHAGAIGLVESTRLDVAETAPGVAARRHDGECGAITRGRLVETTEVHECVAEQHARRQEIGHQRRGARQRIRCCHAVAAQLQLPTEVEPGHGRGRVEFRRLAPAGECAIEIAAGRECAGQVAAQQGIVRPLRQRASQRGHSLGSAPLPQLQQPEQSQGFRMFARVRDQAHQRRLRVRGIAVTDAACSVVQLRDHAVGQADDTRIGGVTCGRRTGSGITGRRHDRRIRRNADHNGGVGGVSRSCRGRSPRRRRCRRARVRR